MSDSPAVQGQEREQRENLHKLLGEMLINVTDQVFIEKSLYIDGYRFVNCIFSKCKLMTQRGTFEFHHCFAPDSSPIFNFETLKSVQLYHMGETVSAFALPGFSPKINEDGSFSIAPGASL